MPVGLRGSIVRRLRGRQALRKRLGRTEMADTRNKTDEHDQIQELSKREIQEPSKREMEAVEGGWIGTVDRIFQNWHYPRVPRPYTPAIRDETR